MLFCRSCLNVRHLSFTSAIPARSSSIEVWSANMARDTNTIGFPSPIPSIKSKQDFVQIAAQRRVLIAEPSAVTRTMLDDILIDGGFQTNLVASLADLHLAAQKNPHDLLFISSWFPDGSGCEAISRLRSTAALSTVPIIAVASTDELAVSLEALNSGANDCISKPLRSSEILTRTYLVIRNDNQHHSSKNSSSEFYASLTQTVASRLSQLQEDIILDIENSSQRSRREFSDSLNSSIHQMAQVILDFLNGPNIDRSNSEFRPALLVCRSILSSLKGLQSQRIANSTQQEITASFQRFHSALESEIQSIPRPHLSFSENTTLTSQPQ